MMFGGSSDDVGRAADWDKIKCSKFAVLSIKTFSMLMYKDNRIFLISQTKDIEYFCMLNAR